MKIEWVNQGKEFEPPKITVATELEILKYLDANTKDMTSVQKNICEFIETVYYVFNKVDRNVTRDMVRDNLTLSELGNIFTVIRTQGTVKYTCPYCKKKFSYRDMPSEGDKNFHEPKP